MRDTCKPELVEGSALSSPLHRGWVDNFIAVHLVPSFVGVDIGALDCAEGEGRAGYPTISKNELHP
jgi:hypothetical protein